MCVCINGLKKKEVYLYLFIQMNVGAMGAIACGSECVSVYLF